MELLLYCVQYHHLSMRSPSAALGIGLIAFINHAPYRNDTSLPGMPEFLGLLLRWQSPGSQLAHIWGILFVYRLRSLPLYRI